MRTERLVYLDGLRGIAALMVFMIHSGAPAIRALGPAGRSIVDHGKFGVTVFFVVSAFSLCVSLRPAFEGGRVSWTAYFIRRFFRIAPLYYAVLVWVLIAGDVAIQRTDYTQTALFHFTFANVFAPQFANDLISVEWSIAVEWGFYLVLPVLVLLCGYRFGVAVLIVAAAALLWWRNDIAMSLGPTFYANRTFSLLIQFYAFAMGMVTYLVIAGGLMTATVRLVLTALSVVMVAAMLWYGIARQSG